MHTFNKIVLRVAVSGLLLALGLRPQRPLFASPTATIYTVDTTDDRLDDDTSDGVCHTSVNTCALRAAIMQANHLNGPGTTTILLPAGTYILTRPIGGGNSEASGDLNLTTPLGANQTINLLGAGASLTIIDANQIDRVLGVSGGRTAIISDVTLRNGFNTGSGGGLSNNGTLTLSGIVISDSEAGGAGGGLYNNGTLTVTHSTLSGNQSGVYGGGISNYSTLTLSESILSGNQAGTSGGGLVNFGSLLVVNSTIDHNHAEGSLNGDGGGIINSAGSLLIVNSTISHNDAVNNGGGLYNVNVAEANIYNTTVVSNDANLDADNYGLGGGVYNYNGSIMNLRNSLVAGNTISNSLSYADCTGTLGLYGVNLIALSDEGLSDCTIGGTGVWVYLNSLAYLGDLQDNGGPTWTHALLPGSNAIDGDNVFSPMDCIDPYSNPLLTDQRGASRAAGSSCDIGAFEYQLPLFLTFLSR